MGDIMKLEDYDNASAKLTRMHEKKAEEMVNPSELSFIGQMYFKDMLDLQDKAIRYILLRLEEFD
jgi:hypothetical protein